MDRKKKTWAKEEREKLRDEAFEIGSRVKFYYMDTSQEILRQRIINRNNNLGKYEFYMPEEQLEDDLSRWYKYFQPPLADELKTYDDYRVIKST